MSRPSRSIYLTATVFYLGTVTATLSSPSHDLFERSSTCANSGDVQCGNGLPGNFCCPSSDVCLVVASNTTAICCTSVEECQVFAPVTCDIQAQNVTANPGEPLMTTNLAGTLTTCGSGCCPFGYSCSKDTCVIDPVQDQTDSAKTTGSSLSATSTATLTQILPSSSTTTSAATTSPASASASASASATTTQQKCSSFPAPAVLVGFFPGLLGGALLACAAFCLIGARRRRKQDGRRDSSTFGRVAASVSDPIYDENSAMRSDFLRRPSPSQGGRSSTATTPSRGPAIERVRSLFRKSAAANGMTVQRTPEMHSVPAMPRTPRLQREPSSESINIFADPGTAQAAAAERMMTPPQGPRAADRDSRQTTFTDLMERADLAGLKKGEPFVPGYMSGALAKETGRALTPRAQRGV